MNLFFFGVYPYICLVIMTLGLAIRYVGTPGEWNARSSNLFAKKSLLTGSFLFHYTVILVFFGHVVGLLFPVRLLDAVGFSVSTHMLVAGVAGMIFAPCVLIGLGILLWRRMSNPNVWASTVPMDIVVIVFIMWQACTGGWQDYFGTMPAFIPVGEWVRGILICQPNPEIMEHVPVAIKIHVVCGFAIFAMIPFSRLVHFFSIPVTWFARPLISYRRRYENL